MNNISVIARNFLTISPLIVLFVATSGSVLAQGPATAVVDGNSQLPALTDADTFNNQLPVFTRAELEEFVAPIALYPDNLIAIILPASTYPLQIVLADRFLEQLESDSTLQPDEYWDDSVTALLNYPEVVQLMSDRIEWTWQLGEAVVNQEVDVLNAIGDFRDLAYTAGNLNTDEYQEVNNSGETIVITQRDETVVYVPYYAPAEVIVYQPRPVYYYYPTPRSVYYYPYASGHRFTSGFFWGVTTAFTIGWSDFHLHVYHPSYSRHPYYGHNYYSGHHYRRPDIRTFNRYYVDNSRRSLSNRYRDGSYWRPQRGSGVRPSNRRERNQNVGNNRNPLVGSDRRNNGDVTNNRGNRSDRQNSRSGANGNRTAATTNGRQGSGRDSGGGGRSSSNALTNSTNSGGNITSSNNRARSSRANQGAVTSDSRSRVQTGNSERNQIAAGTNRVNSNRLRGNRPESNQPITANQSIQNNRASSLFSQPRNSISGNQNASGTDRVNSNRQRVTRIDSNQSAIANQSTQSNRVTSRISQPRLNLSRNQRATTENSRRVVRQSPVNRSSVEPSRTREASNRNNRSSTSSASQSQRSSSVSSRAPSRAVSNQAASNRTAPNRASSNRAAPNRTAPNRASSNRAASSRAAPNRASSNRAAPSRAPSARSGASQNSRARSSSNSRSRRSP